MSLAQDLIRTTRVEIDRRGWSCPCCRRGDITTHVGYIPQDRSFDLSLSHPAANWREILPAHAALSPAATDLATSWTSTVDRSHPHVSVCVRISESALQNSFVEPVSIYVGRMLRDINQRLQPTQPTDNMPTQPSLFPRRNFLPATAPNNGRALPRIRNINMTISATGRTVYEFDVEVQQPYVELVRESTYKPGGLVTLNGVNCIIHEVSMDALEFGNVDFHCRAVPAAEAIAAGRGTPTHTHEPAKPMRAVDDLPVVHVPVTPVTRRVIR